MVERDLEALLQNPDDPGFLWAWWKGSPKDQVRWRSRIAVVGGRALFRYIVFQDHPYIAPVFLGDVAPVVEEADRELGENVAE
jgi:hypothetical protein